MANYRQQSNSALGTLTACPSCAPPFIPCSSSESSGGAGITDYSASLSSGGGLLACLFNPQGVPDKLEIMHGAAAGTKKATTGMNATDNYGPFDNVYGTETANTVPTASQTLSVQQFIGTDKGVAATRLTEFTTETGYEVPSLTIGGVTYQQAVWWTYSDADYLANSTATIRVTGATGTGWNLIRLCCPDGNCVVPTPTPVSNPAGSSVGTSALACSSTDIVHDFYFEGNVIEVGATVYTDVGVSNVFVGNSGWYRVDSPGATRAMQINSLGEIIGTMSLCP